MAATAGARVAKVVSAEEFSENDRWDVTRFWFEDELVALGHNESAVMCVDFIDETMSEIEEIGSELEAAKKELQALTSGKTTTISLNDSTYFDVRSGTRVTGKEIREHPGKLPIYSCFKTDREVKGLVDEEFFQANKKGTIEEKTIVTVNANGASVGKVFVRRDRCGITDDVIIVEPKGRKIDHDYLAVALRAAVYKGGFLYEAKLFATRVKELEVEVPVSKSGEFDVKQQQTIASAVHRFDALRTRLHDLGLRSESVRTI